MKFPDVEISITVPSGRLVVDNDLRDLFPDANEDARYEGGVWTKDIMEAYGRVGLFHGYVGNSCPGVYKNGNTLYIGNPPADKECFELSDEPFVAHPQIPGEHVAGVCTDLWWYSICDYDEYIKRGGKINRSIWAHQNPDVVKVEPGPYLLKHHWPFSDRGDSYRKERMIYATIERSYRAPRKWKFPEEDLEGELRRLMCDLGYFCIEPSNEARTEFKILAHMLDDTIFSIKKVQLEHVTDPVKIAIIIRKEHHRKKAEQRRINRWFEDLKKNPLTKVQKGRINKMLDFIKNGLD